MGNCGTGQKNAHSQCLGGSRRQCRRQGTPQLLRDTSSGSPSGEGSSDKGSEWSSHQSTMTRGSRESNQAGREGKGLRMKVNLPTIKDKKTKDTVTCHSLQWDIAIFHHSHCDDHHLLPYILQFDRGSLWTLPGV